MADKTQNSEKERALAALRVWRAYFDDRDSLLINARKAGATIAEIMEASKLAKGTVRAVVGTAEDTDQENMMPTTTDHLVQYHHPHYISGTVTTTRSGSMRLEIQMRPFTGIEPEPTEPPEIWGLDREDRELLRAEYQILRGEWAKARLRKDARPVLAQAAPVWENYRAAREAMDAEYAKFWTGEADGGKWKRQVLHLVEAQETALAAAQDWDNTAVELARLERFAIDAISHYRLTHAASDIGMDISTWDVRDLDDYEGDKSWGWSPRLLAQDVATEIEQQKERLKQVAELAGDTAS